MRKLIKTFSVVGILFLTTSGWAQTNTFPSSGNVGIGTTNPNVKLDVNGGIIRAQFTQNQVNNVAIDDLNGEFGSRGIISNHGGDFHLRGFWGVVIDKNGGNYGESSSYNNGVTPAGGTFAVRTRTSATSFRTDFIIRNNGNIGIGTTNPSTKLSVNGTTKTKEVIVTEQASDWPDYVFSDPGYQLPNLGELETYINEYKHLPGIPTKDDIEKEGQYLGAIQKELLEKIEELTLYTIDQQKRIEALEEKLEQLQNKK